MPFLKRVLRGLFNLTLGPVLAVVLIFEEWGWEPLQRLMARLARLPLWARMEALIVRLPPYLALMVFFVPALLLLPIKLLALYWIGRGHALLGIGLVLTAKMLGTAAVARLFALTQPALMRLTWFARLYNRWKPWKDGLIAKMKATAAWHTLSATVQAMAQSLRSVRDWFRH
jgi:hypothetical protein